MNNALDKGNVIYIVIKSFVLAVLMTLLENWRQNNLAFDFSSNGLSAFMFRFIISFFVLLIVEVVRQNK